MVAKKLSDALRPYDMVGRWGGEEFVVVTCHTDIAKLNILAERIRILISASYLEFNNKTLSTTVSIGGSFATEHDNTISIIARADSLMYESKKAGRNRVTIR